MFMQYLTINVEFSYINVLEYLNINRFQFSLIAKLQIKLHSKK